MFFFSFSSHKLWGLNCAVEYCSLDTVAIILIRTTVLQRPLSPALLTVDLPLQKERMERAADYPRLRIQLPVSTWYMQFCFNCIWPWDVGVLEGS